MKFLAITAASLLAVPCLAETQAKDARAAPDAAAQARPIEGPGPVIINPGDRNPDQDRPNEDVFELIYFNSDSEKKPGTFVEVDEVLAYETIEVDGQRPHCHHCPKPYHHGPKPCHQGPKPCHHKPECHYPHPPKPPCNHPHPHPHRPASPCGECGPRPHHPHGPSPPKHKPKDVVTDCLLCKKLNYFADELYYIWDIPVWKAIYAIEYQIDELDELIDKSPLDSCFDCRQESKIACCYKTYAEALIRLLTAISEKSQYLPGDVDKYLVTAINSLRAADYAFVYELARRMQCGEYIKEIMKKQGALDGSTEGSIRAAFTRIVATPYITGDNFEGWADAKKPGKRDMDDKTTELMEQDVHMKRVQPVEMGPGFELVRRVLDKHAKKGAKPEDLDSADFDPELLELVYEYLDIDYPRGLFREAAEILSPEALQLAMFKAADKSSDEAKTFVVEYLVELVAGLEGFLSVAEYKRSAV
ncbi:hypothetical protein LIA77_05621 [Sarocladium implicatum]|nr:hypothetical protein LIA77_05621 [Sarocladium implicatum]